MEQEDVRSRSNTQSLCSAIVYACTKSDVPASIYNLHAALVNTCVGLGAHNTKYLISAWPGSECKKYLIKANEHVPNSEHALNNM